MARSKHNIHRLKVFVQRPPRDGERVAGLVLAPVELLVEVLEVLVVLLERLVR